jgi:hypothetical protein
VLFQFFPRHFATIKLAVNVHFSHSSSNEVRVLRPKVQNSNLGTIKKKKERECESE